jgi:hypothetical protein
MAEKVGNAEKAAPSGLKRKGGRRYPRESLKDVLGYSKKLVSKTHTAPQPREIIYPGVFNSNTSLGEIRASATKQFGLMEGTTKGLKASQLAKDIEGAAPDQKLTLIRRAALKPSLFKDLFETFKGDVVSKAKIRQQVSNLDVHPDFLDNAVNIFVESMMHAVLADRQGDDIRLDPIGAFESTKHDAADDKSPHLDVEHADRDDSDARPKNPPADPPPLDRRAHAVIHVNVSLDSSMDTDKLAKQLQILREYGAL